MKIAVMGAGALGGYFGGRLSAAGHEVTLIARGAHLAAIRDNGLRIQSPHGDLHLPEIAATDDPGTVDPVDIVLFMVKNYDVETSAEAIKPMLRPDTMVVTSQNGISAPDRLADIVGWERVVPGVARIPADVPAPGVINHSAEMDMWSFGERNGEISPRVALFRDALNAAVGCTAVVPDNIMHDLWAKFISQTTLASLTTLTRLNLGPIRNTKETRDLFTDAMREVDAVGKAALPDLPDGLIAGIWEKLDRLPDTMHASMLDDLNAGKRLEVDYLSGDVVRLGIKHGVPTPIHKTFWAALQPFKHGQTP